MYLLSPLPESKVHGANMGSIWGRQDPGGPQVGPMDFAIWAVTVHSIIIFPSVTNYFPSLLLLLSRLLLLLHPLLLPIMFFWIYFYHVW